MTTHTPEDVETIARLLANASGFDPDETQFGASADPWWKAYIDTASHMLDGLQAKGWKILDRQCTDAMYRVTPGDTWIKGVWTDMHDAAPIVPRGDA